MKGIPDHPDDVAARLRIRAGLVQRRVDADLSAQAVARLAGFAREDTVRLLERENRTSWEAWRLQQWARGLGFTFRLAIVGLPVPDDDVTAVVLKTATAFGAFDEDQMHLKAVAYDLARTRVALGVHRSTLARWCGVDERAIRGWERQPLYSLLRVYQRYPRALGGSLELELQPAQVAVAS
ncbi:hypothetical protein ACWKSP_26265 [Micromonosporaceae bacterium Da 78-11]